MDKEELIKRVKENQKVEELAKEDRDFEILILTHELSKKLNNSMRNMARRTAKLAYCHARKGRIEEAKNELEKLKDYSLGMDSGEYYRVVTLLSFFITNNAENLDLVQLNTIRNWLQDPEASIQVKEIIFDYIDFI